MIKAPAISTRETASWKPISMFRIRRPILLKFIKLIPAIIRMIKAMENRTNIVWRLAFGIVSKSTLVRKWRAGKEVRW